MEAATFTIICKETTFEVPENTIPYLGDKLIELIDDHRKESPDAPYELISNDVRPQDFKNLVEFAKLMSTLPKES